MNPRILIVAALAVVSGSSALFLDRAAPARPEARPPVEALTSGRSAP